MGWSITDERTAVEIYVVSCKVTNKNLSFEPIDFFISLSYVGVSLDDCRTCVGSWHEASHNKVPF